MTLIHQMRLGLALTILISFNVSAENFKVTLLGTGTPIPSVERFGSSTLVEVGSEKLLFDVGRGTAQRLWQLNIPLRAITNIFFTHYHSDHTVGLPDLWLTGWLPAAFGQRTTALPVWGPSGIKEFTANLEKAYQADIQIRMADEKLLLAGVSFLVKEISEGVVYEKNGLKVTAFNVDHGLAIKPALGYRVDYGGHSVVISGDTCFCENLIRYAKGTDVVIHEVAAAKEELLAISAPFRAVIAHHTKPEQAGVIFNQIKPKLAVYTHLVLLSSPSISAPTIEEIVASTRQTYSGDLVVGTDLMSIEIGDEIEVHPFATPISE